MDTILNVKVDGLTEVGTAEKSFKSLRQELSSLKQELASGSLQGEALEKAAARAAELDDNIRDVSARVRNLGSDTRRLDGLLDIAQGIAGGFAAAQGAIALFTDENEELQKVLVKVQASVALVSGVQAVANTLQKESSAVLLLNTIRTNALAAAQTVYAFATGGATVATNAFRIALLATGIGAVVVLIVAAVKAYKDYTSSVEDAAEAQERLNTAIAQETEYLTFEMKLREADNAKRLKLAELEGASVQELARLKKIAIQDEIDGLQRIINENNKSVDSQAKNAELKLKQQQLLTQAEIIDAETRKALRDKEEQQNKQAFDKAKQLRDQERADRQSYYAELAKEGLEAHNQLQDQLDQARLDDEEYELLQLQKKYEAQKSVLERNLQETNQLTELYEFNRLSIKQKYQNQELTELEGLYKEALDSLAEADNERNQVQKKELDDFLALNNAKRSIATDTANSLISLGETVTDANFKYTAAGKIIALAQIATDTALAISAAVRAANQDPASVAGGPVAVAANIIGRVAVIAANIANAKKVLQSSVPNTGGSAGASGGSSGFGQSSPSRLTRPGQQEQDVNNIKPIKVYVVETDITGKQKTVRDIELNAVIE